MNAAPCKVGDVVRYHGIPITIERIYPGGRNEWLIAGSFGDSGSRIWLSYSDLDPELPAGKVRLACVAGERV